MPGSIRPFKDLTHLNGTGYSIIGRLVYESLLSSGALTSQR